MKKVAEKIQNTEVGVLVKKVLSKNLKKYRAEAKMTQEQASARAEISLKYWQRLEMTSQVDLPSLPTLSKIAKALDVKAYKLLVE